MLKLIAKIHKQGLLIYLRNKMSGTELPGFKLHRSAFQGKCGIEIGGPSPIFKNNKHLPVYKHVDRIDGCNFSNHTLWEGNVKKSNFYHKRNGHQYISDGTLLTDIANETYDFVISSNCLEHIANPLKALHEWLRVLKQGGYLLLVVPSKHATFDRNRETTAFEHILDDYEKNVSEDDLTHLDEILTLHDLSLDPLAGTFEQFKRRSLDNFHNRTLHHHVFDLELLFKLFDYLRIELLYQYQSENCIVLGRKLS